MLSLMLRLSLSLSLSLSVMLYSGGGLVNGGKEIVLVEAVGVRVASGLVLRVGVGDGVISVEGDTSTSSASRYHLRRRV